MERDELIKRLEELDPSDAYHKGVELDTHSYYAAIDRAICFIKGELISWTDPPEHEARPAHPLTQIGRVNP